MMKDVKNTLSIQFFDKLKTYLNEFVYKSDEFLFEKEKYSSYALLFDFCNKGKWNEPRL